MAYQTLFFDLDDTLYPPSSGVWDAIGLRIEEYIEQRVGVPHDQVAVLREQLYRTYGTTLRGLALTRGVDSADYLAYVHDIPVQQFLSPDPRIQQVLARYPQRKVIFTNADRAHAERVLAALDLAGAFDQIIDVVAVAPYCKPMPDAFRQALRLAGATDPRECILLDDAAHNLRAAHEQGFYTIRVGPGPADGCCDAAIPSLAEAPTVLDPLLAPPG